MSSEEIVYCYLAYFDGMDRRFRQEVIDFGIRAAICVLLILVMSGVTIFMRHSTVLASELYDGMVNITSPTAAESAASSYYDDVMDEAEDSYLSGDTRLACEAVLCLSSGYRPSECGPSLSRYFGIHHKKWKNTLKARRNFLRLCPSANVDGNMETLVEAIINGAGRCNASELNSSHFTYMPKKVCKRVYDSDYGGYVTRCREIMVQVIDNKLPSYCTNYNNHDYTYQVGVHYVGDPLEGGHWVDDYVE